VSPLAALNHAQLLSREQVGSVINRSAGMGYFDGSASGLLVATPMQQIAAGRAPFPPFFSGLFFLDGPLIQAPSGPMRPWGRMHRGFPLGPQALDTDTEDRRPEARPRPRPRPETEVLGVRVRGRRARARRAS
jgi:hypothetical protein